MNGYDLLVKIFMILEQNWSILIQPTMISMHSDVSWPEFLDPLPCTRNVSVWFYWHLNQKQNLKSDWEMFLKVDWIVHRNTDHETFARLTLMMLDEITYWMMCHNDKTSWIRIPVCEVALIMTIWEFLYVQIG